MAGILVSLGYMSGSAVIAPDLWAEPLGALVKTGPAIILMLFCSRYGMAADGRQSNISDASAWPDDGIILYDGVCVLCLG